MFVLLLVLVFVYHFGLGIYSVSGLEPSPTFEFLETAAFVCGVVWWLRAEAQTSTVKRFYCLGLLVGVGWIIIVPYHLIKTRGVRGLIPLLALIASFVAAYLLAAVVYMIRSN